MDPSLRLLLGFFETYVYSDITHIIVHILLLILQLNYNLLIPVLLHILLNLRFQQPFSFTKSAAYKLKEVYENRQRRMSKRRQRPNKPKPRRRRNQRNMGSPLQAYAAMVADPCNGPMLEGFYSTSEGMLNKLKTVYSNSETATQGYILWDPNYTTNFDSSPTSTNCIIQWPADTVTNPDNLTTSRFATGDVTQTGVSLNVGAAGFTASDTVSDARCVGACLRVSYTGRMDAASGLIAIIDNIPAEALLGVDGVTPASVDELFARSSKVERLGLDTAEVKFRPSLHSEIFRSDSEGVFDIDVSTVTTISAEAERSGSRLMGFAFKGISSFSDLLFEFHQNIEWRPNLDAGFVDRSPVQTSNPGNAQKVINYLDKNHPTWTHNLGHMITDSATSIAKMAFTGTVGRIGSGMMQAAVRRSLPVIARGAPLLLTL
jgi:hypothetical protein